MKPERIEQADAALREALATLLVDTVATGASIGWVRTPSHDAALAFWDGVLAGVQRGERQLWVCREGTQVLAAAQLVTAGPENGQLRAEVCKVMTHPAARRRGLARVLMQKLHAEAQRLGKRLLVLDTNTDSPAQRLYEQLGWNLCGVMPDYALQADGSLGATSWMFLRVIPR